MEHECINKCMSSGINFKQKAASRTEIHFEPSIFQHMATHNGQTDTVRFGIISLFLIRGWMRFCMFASVCVWCVLMMHHLSNREQFCQRWTASFNCVRPVFFCCCWFCPWWPHNFLIPHQMDIAPTTIAINHNAHAHAHTCAAWINDSDSCTRGGECNPTFFQSIAHSRKKKQLYIKQQNKKLTTPLSHFCCVFLFCFSSIEDVGWVSVV